jgi:prohibitin 2
MKKSILFLALPLAACGQVDTGHRGVFVNFGHPTEVVGEGLHWYNPWSYDLDQVDVRQIKWESTTETYTKDVQQATIRFALTYHLDPARVLNVYANVGKDWAATMVPQVVEQNIKNVVGRARAVEDAINNRGVVSDAIDKGITAQLRAKGIIVDGFQINDISFTKNFEEAVERKQVAVQNAETAKNTTVQIQEQANQRVIAANADAEAMKIKTAALAGNAKLVEYEAVQKWNGQLPQYMLGNGATPFVKVP